MLRKNGYIRRLECKILLSYDIKEGLQGVLFVTHRKQQKDELIMLIDEQGLVIEVDESVSKAIDKGTRIGECCYELQAALRTALNV